MLRRVVHLIRFRGRVETIIRELDRPLRHTASSDRLRSNGVDANSKQIDVLGEGVVRRSVRSPEWRARFEGAEETLGDGAIVAVCTPSREESLVGSAGVLSPRCSG